MRPITKMGGVLALALCAAGCTVNPFCLECSDAAPPPPPDATPDACVEGSVEHCNGFDDDCDGLVDEGFNFDEDPQNCGGCGNACVLPHARGVCHEGECLVQQCLPGAENRDGVDSNGCEAACTVVDTVTSDHCSGGDCCDAADNDCDGDEGEDHDVSSDPRNCGGCSSDCTAFPCPHVCFAANADVDCVAGVCTFTACHAGYHDTDGDPANGCEYHCEPAGDEECNNLDDNCDGDVDETFPGSGLECGRCNAGAIECVGGLVQCVMPDDATMEVCDGADNDCDAATPDGVEDPQVGTACGVVEPDGCPRGTWVCTGGSLTCDDALDLRGQVCGTDVGECAFGTWACVDDGDGPEFQCQGGQEPVAEVCGDGVDGDCDGNDDESDGDLALGAPCDNDSGFGGIGACIFGTISCVGGELECSGFAGPVTEICNGMDDDCNGVIDDGMSLGSSCPETSLGLGNRMCLSRDDQVCVGYVPGRPEICDGLDNDNDGDTDEDAPCPEGSVCSRDHGQCVMPCLPEEAALRCPIGMNCVNDECVGNLCAEQECDACDRCDPSTGMCVDRCAGLSCPEGLVCHCGRCWPPTCGILGCPEGQMCVAERCVDDPCATAGCEAEQGCAGGDCFEVCEPHQCPPDQHCVRGECESDPCADIVCSPGECDPDTRDCSVLCNGTYCLPGQRCDLATGRCVDDVCLVVHCPEGTTCEDGSCFAPPPPQPDGGPDPDGGAEATEAGVNRMVYATGGGGSYCTATSMRAALPAGVLIFVLALAWYWIRRRDES